MGKMKRKIRPANEELGGVLYTVFFVILWYSGIIRAMIAGGYQATLLIFLMAGLIPLYTAWMQIRRAMFYRKQRAEAIAWGNAAPGRITGVMMQKQPYYTERHHYLRYQNYYFLQVEITDPSTGVEQTIQSEGYRRPVHRCLASDTVRVYRDRSGWKYYLEDFQLKEHRSDPGIFLSVPGEFEDTAAGSGAFLRGLTALVMMLLILFNLFGWS